MIQSTDKRPKRDVSARNAIGECEECGGNAHSLLGGEHIWKCSEVVPKAVLEELIDELKHRKQRASERYQETQGGSFENGKALGRYQAYNEFLNHIVSGSEEAE